MKKILSYIIETRAGILSTTIMPVLLGTALAAFCGHKIDITLFWIILVGFIFTHLGTNIINDYFDARDGTDNINRGFIGPFTGGSRILQSKALSMAEVLAEGILFFAAALVCFIAASLRSNGIILISGALGMAAGIFYSAPPIKIARKGLGEALVFLIFGPLMAFAAYTAQMRVPDMEPVIISIPLGLLTAAFVIIAEFPDYQADKETGKNNLTVRLGIKNARFLYAAVCAAAYLSIPAGISMGIMPIKGLFAGFAAFVSLAACIELWKKYETPSKLGLACGLTLAAHLICGILLIASYF